MVKARVQEDTPQSENAEPDDNTNSGQVKETLSGADEKMSTDVTGACTNTMYTTKYILLAGWLKRNDARETQLNGDTA